MREVLPQLCLLTEVWGSLYSSLTASQARAHHPKIRETPHSKDLRESKKVQRERLDLAAAGQSVSSTLRPAQSYKKTPDHGHGATAGIL